jgi:hypothetical protein
LIGELQARALRHAIEFRGGMLGPRTTRRSGSARCATAREIRSLGARRCADHQHSQHGQFALAGVAQCGTPLCRASIPSANTPTPSPARPRPGLRSTKTARSRSSLESGRAGTDVGAIHPKAMPVIRTSQEAVEQWLTLPPKERSHCKNRCRTGRSELSRQGEGRWDGGLALQGTQPSEGNLQ